MTFSKIQLPKHLNGDLYLGDNLEIMKSLPSNSIDLIYGDPPFYSQRNYSSESKIDKGEIREFTDTFDSLNDYLRFLHPRLIEIKRLLKNTGSIYIHLDWHAVHYVKVMMDKIFGYDNFQNEIIWKRSQVQQKMTKTMISENDNILWYSKTDNIIYNKQYIQISEKEKFSMFPDTEIETGRRYRIAPLEQRNSFNKDNSRIIQSKKITSTEGKGWAWSQKTFDERLKENPYLISWSENGRPRYKLYADEFEGKQCGNIWTDINIIAATNSSERLDYPTQKPEALLERIIKASSNEGDIVADFFGGSGTTASVCQRLNRKWITCDKSEKSIEVIKARLYGNKSVKETSYQIDVENAWN